MLLTDSVDWHSAELLRKNTTASARRGRIGSHVFEHALWRKSEVPLTEHDKKQRLENQAF